MTTIPGARQCTAGLVALPIVVVFLVLLAILAYALDRNSRSALEEVYRAHAGHSLVAEAQRDLWMAQMALQAEVPKILADGSRTEFQEEIMQLHAGDSVTFAFPTTPPIPGEDFATCASDVTARIQLVDGNLSEAFEPRPVPPDSGTTATAAAGAPEIASATGPRDGRPGHAIGSPDPVTLSLLSDIDFPQGVHVRWARWPSGCGYHSQVTGPASVPETQSATWTTGTGFPPTPPVPGITIPVHPVEESSGGRHHAWIAVGQLRLTIALSQKADRLTTTRTLTETKLVAFDALHRTDVENGVRIEHTESVSMVVSPYYVSRHTRDTGDTR